MFGCNTDKGAGAWGWREDNGEKSEWHVDCMCRETSTPWSWAELGFKEPCLCPQHWTNGTQRPGLLRGQGGVFEGLQQNLPPFTQQHRHRPQGSEHDHVTSGGFTPHLQLLTSSPGRRAAPVLAAAGSRHQLFGSLPVGHAVASEASMAVLLGRTPAAGTDPPGKERLELGAGSSGCIHHALARHAVKPCPVSPGKWRFKALPPLALLRYDLHVKLVCI